MINNKGEKSKQRVFCLFVLYFTFVLKAKWILYSFYINKSISLTHKRKYHIANFRCFGKLINWNINSINFFFKLFHFVLVTWSLHESIFRKECGFCTLEVSVAVINDTRCSLSKFHHRASRGLTRSLPPWAAVES